MTICNVLGMVWTIGTVSATKLSSSHYYPPYVGMIH